MRHYIKTLAMLLMVSLGFTACNDTEDFDDYKVTYPTSVPLGYYHSEYTIEGDYEYGVMLTKNAEDETVFQLIMEGKPYGSDSASVRTLLATTDIVYNDTIGTMVASDTIGDNFYETPMVAHFAYKMDKHHMILSVQHGNKKFTSVLAPTAEAPAVASRWIANNFTIDLKSINNEAGQLPGMLAIGENEPVALVYSLNGNNGEFTTEKNEKGTFSYNEKFQLIVTLNGTTYTCDRTYSVPEPETFIQVANGTYSHSIGVLQGPDGPMGGPVFTDVYESGLYQSDKNPSLFVINPWLNNPNGLVLMVDQETGAVTVPQQSTGNNHPQYGEIYAVDVLSYTGGQINSNSYFDGKVFHLDLAYVVEAGFFGMVNETYEITETAESNVKLNSVQKHNLNCVFEGKKLYTKNF